MAGRQKPTQMIRMDDNLKKRIEKWRAQLAAQTGMPVTFSAAVRRLIERGLEAK